MPEHLLDGNLTLHMYGSEIEFFEAIRFPYEHLLPFRVNVPGGRYIDLVQAIKYSTFKHFPRLGSRLEAPVHLPGEEEARLQKIS